MQKMTHLGREVKKLKQFIMELASDVEASVKMAVEAVTVYDVHKAETVKNKGKNIDYKEVDIEEECLKILALYQPVASDLRYVVACLKMNNDLERIGDLAENIASRAIDLINYQQSAEKNGIIDFKPMTDATCRILKESLDSLMNMDEKKAKQVILADDIIDNYHADVHKKVAGLIRQKPDKVQYYIYFLSVSKSLERIGDYATNIAEDVIYMISGNIVRHQSKIN